MVEDTSPDSVKINRSCNGCVAYCCRYLAVEIDSPETEDEYDTIRWYIAHNTWVFYEDDGWYLYIRNPCQFLNADGRCDIYESRPAICREHSNKECERWEAWEPELLFKTVEEWEIFADRELKKKLSKTQKKKHRKMKWLIDRR